MESDPEVILADKLKETCKNLGWNLGSFTFPEKTVVVTSFENCARCGKEHTHLVFHPLKNPTEKYTHWGMCPILIEPIMLFSESLC